MESGTLAFVEKALGAFKDVHPLITAAILFAVAQAIMGFIRFLVDWFGRRHEERLRRWQALGKSYETCLHELCLARRIPFERNDLEGKPGFWHWPKSFNGAMAGLVPLMGKLTMLEAYSHSRRSKKNIREARASLDEVLAKARREPLTNIQPGERSKSNTIKARADCGLAKEVEDTISIISDCSRMDLSHDPLRCCLFRWWDNIFSSRDQNTIRGTYY